MRRHTKIAAGLFASALLLAGCAATGTASGRSASPTTTAAENVTTGADAGVEGIDAAVATDADAGVDVDWSRLATMAVTLTDDGLAITEAGTYVLTGTTSGPVTVDSAGAVRIVLDGVTITSRVGAAIQIDNAELVVLELADGSRNVVADASTRSDEEIDGAIYSSDDLYVTGRGALEITANFADGIVGKDDLWILSGTVDVTSVDDGIRGKDSLHVDGGTITIDAKGDGLKASNATDLGRGQLTITAGTVTIASGDDAIKAEQKIWITGGTVAITGSVEGIEAPVIVIDGGDITVNASDDGINASASDIVTSGLSITIAGGNLTVVMGAGDTDAIDSNGDLAITGGTIDITAPSPFDFDGTGVLDDATVVVNGQAVTQLTNQMMGGPMGGGARGRPS